MLFGKLKLTSKLAVIIGAVLAVIFALLIGVTISTTSTSIGMEGFGAPSELPNLTAYNETWAAPSPSNARAFILASQLYEYPVQ